MGKKNYNDNIILTEYLSDLVQYESHYENKNNISFKYDLNNKKLIWNIYKLKKGEELYIYYLVKIIKGKSGDKIESSGFVANIPSFKIINTIGINLDKKR